MRTICLGMLLLVMAGVLFAQTMVSLDDAVVAGATEIEGRLAAGVKVVVLNFRSPSARLSNYVLDEMMTVLVRSGKIQVVDRANLELIRQEMNFQMSGDVSDTSAQQIGVMLGAQSIISGSIEDMGNYQRMRFRVIAVETAAIQAMTSHNVRNDAQLTNLMRDSTSVAVNRPPTGTTTPTTTTIQPSGLNFSTGRKVGAGFLNLAFGLGSYTMGDWVDGLILTGSHALAWVFMVSYWNSFEDIYDERGDFLDYEVDYNLYIISVGFFIFTAVYSFICPFTYDTALAKKNGTFVGFEKFNPIEHINIMPTVDKNGRIRMGLLFSGSY